MTDVTPTIYGLQAEPLAEDTIPLEAITILKILDEDGVPTIEIRATGGLADWDAIGLLTVALDVTREEAAACWRPDDD